MSNQFTAPRPLPWRTTDNGDSRHATLISDAHGVVIASAWMICEKVCEKGGRIVELPRTITEANARFIVRAVNERSQLLELIEQLADLAENAVNVLSANFHVFPGITDQTTMMGKPVKPILDRAREILREAEHA